MTIAQKLHAAVVAVAPIHGVAIVDEQDRSTWRIDFDASATQEQRGAAQEVLEEFDPIPPPIPQVISDRQFAHALWQSNLITFDEALAFVQTGTIPAQIAAAIDQIPDEMQRKSTQLLVAGAIEYQRTSPAVAALAAVLGWNDAQIDALWTLGASL